VSHFHAADSRTVQNASLVNTSPADPSSWKYPNGTPGSLGRAKSILTEDARVDVIEDDDITTEPLFQVAAYVDVIPSQVWCRQNATIRQVDRSWASDTDPGQSADFDLGFFQQSFDGGADSLNSTVTAIPPPGLSTTASQLKPTLVIGDRQHLRAAQVEPNPNFFLICGHRSSHQLLNGEDVFAIV
jgi:hypothetical protein